jgi:hypothetical protein
MEDPDLNANNACDKRERLTLLRELSQEIPPQNRRQLTRAHNLAERHIADREAKIRALEAAIHDLSTEGNTPSRPTTASTIRQARDQYVTELVIMSRGIERLMYYVL